VLRYTLVENQRLQSAIALGIALSMATFVMVWLIQPYMQAAGVPTRWFGPIWAGLHLWLAFVSFHSHRVVTRFRIVPTLAGCIVLVALGYGLMAMRGIQGPTITRIVQEDALPDDRASILSIYSMLFRLSFVIFGPLIGLLVDRVGMHSALAWIGTAFTMTIGALWLRFAGLHGRPPEVAA